VTRLRVGRADSSYYGRLDLCGGSITAHGPRDFSIDLLVHTCMHSLCMYECMQACTHVCVHGRGANHFLK